LTQPDAQNDIKLNSLPSLPHDEEGPVFAEPWQAQAFAMAVKLSEQGVFTWKEWTIELAEELQKTASSGSVDDGSQYYEHWVAALERLVIAKSPIKPATLKKRKQAWSDAYRHTPHGKPVLLEPAE